MPLDAQGNETWRVVHQIVVPRLYWKGTSLPCSWESPGWSFSNKQNTSENTPAFLVAWNERMWLSFVTPALS